VVNVLMEESLSKSSSSSSRTVSESSASSESESAPRAEMLSRSSLEVRAPSRVSADREDGANGGKWSSYAAAAAASFRLWMEEVAEAEAECEGDGD